MTEDLLSQLRKMDPYEFEHLIADLWEEMGFQTEVLQQSQDQGIDVRATNQLGQKYLIQVKRHGPNSVVGDPKIREYAGLYQLEDNIDEVYVITTNGFTAQAIDTADSVGVELIDDEELVELITNNDKDQILSGHFPDSDSKSQSASSIDVETPTVQKSYTIPNSQTVVPADIKSGAILHSEDLIDADLINANLSDANLTNADLCDANIINANLLNSDFSNANLSGANLTGADLSGSNLCDTDFSDANLSNADLADVDLSGANLSQANLLRTDLTNAQLTNTDLSSAYLSSVNLSGANLTGADLTDASLTDTDLSDADLTGTIFPDSLIDTTFRGADLSNVDLSQTNLSGADLTGANLSCADFSNANLTNATLPDRLSGRLSGATFRETDLTDTNLSNANLRNVNLSGSDLTGVDLSDASLSGADLSNADLTDAMLPDSLSDATLQGAELAYNSISGERLQCPVCQEWRAEWKNGYPVECDSCGTHWQEVSKFLRTNRWKANEGPQDGDQKTAKQWRKMV